jgi:hypothetical protein
MFEVLLFTVELKRLHGRVKTDLISILEAIGDGLLWAIYADSGAVYLVCLDPIGESLS